jgi:multiple sugar transport system permease protein
VIETQPLAGTAVLRRPDKWRRRTTVERFAPALMLLPAALIVVGLRGIPIIVALFLSFTDADLSKPSSVPLHNVGMQNYSTVLQSTDFQQAVTTTLWIVLPALAIEMAAGLAIALWLNRPMRGKALLRGATLVPYLLVPVVIGNVFRMMYSAQFGQMNYYLGFIGIGSHAWITDPSTVRWAVVLMEAWHTTPFVALLCLAGLTGIPKEHLEAGVVDGANAWQRFRFIVLPALWPILGATLILRGMDALQLFDEVYVLTAGGPGRLTSVINLYFYQFGFRQFRIGQTSASIMIVVASLTVLALLGRFIWNSRKAWTGGVR